jgi:hypothetical protein
MPSYVFSSLFPFCKIVGSTQFPALVAQPGVQKFGVKKISPRDVQIGSPSGGEWILVQFDLHIQKVSVPQILRDYPCWLFRDRGGIRVPTPECCWGCDIP